MFVCLYAAAAEESRCTEGPRGGREGKRERGGAGGRGQGGRKGGREGKREGGRQETDRQMTIGFGEESRSTYASSASKGPACI